MSNKTPKQKNKKEFGVIGLGCMGGDLALQAIEKGWRVVGYNRSPERTRALARKGLVAASSLADLVGELKPPRILLIYVPHGDPTRQMIAKGSVLGNPTALHARHASRELVGMSGCAYRALE
jgi:6-phosphogluconate dehydrogenase (decarboxylating)